MQCLFASFTTNLHATDNQSSASSLQSERVTQRALNIQLSPIKSFSDIRAYESVTQPAQDPLNVLSSTNKKYFIDHLNFNETGITTFSYAPLTGLTATQVYKILSLFGIQDDTSLIKGIQVRDNTDKEIMQMTPLNPLLDHLDYRCSGRTTCSTSFSDICTANC